MSEPFLEPLLRRWRFQKPLKIITPGSTVVDIGCGPQYPFLQLVKNRIKKGIGLDPLTKGTDIDNLEIIRTAITDKVPLKKNTADFVTSFAVLEHLDNYQYMLDESYRILKPGGKLLLTTPTPINRYFCEFLAYRLHLLSEREIREHKRYFDKKILVNSCKKAGFKKIHHKYFELFLNNFLIAEK